MLPPSGSPRVSVEITFLMFWAKRCSLIAIASMSVSRAEATLNGSRATTSEAP